MRGREQEFSPRKIDEAQLLPPSVQDYVPLDHLSRLIVALVREELDLSAIAGLHCLPHTVSISTTSLKANRLIIRPTIKLTTRANATSLEKSCCHPRTRCG